MYQEAKVTPSPEDLARLAAFEADGRPALSIYLELTTVHRRKSARSIFETMASQQLEAGNADRRWRRMLQEDIEIVQMYLSNGSFPYSAGLAIFSCAGRVFWRAYPLPVAVPNRVDIGPTFNLEPLLSALEAIKRRQALLAEAV